MKRFYVYAICFALSVSCCFVLFGGCVVSAAAVECTDPVVTLPDETVVLSFENVDTVQVEDPSSDPLDQPVLYVAPSAGTEFDGLAYLDINCTLGSIRLYLPYGVDLAGVQLRDGMLYNTTNSTIYLYCPDYPDYSFSASRFQNVTYRTSGSAYNSYDLSGVSIERSSVTLSQILPFIHVFALIFITFALFWRRSK